MELCLAHRSFQTKQEAIIEVTGIVESVLVQDERVGQCTDLKKTVPVNRGACQAGDLQPEHDTDSAHPHLGHQAGKALPISRRARLSEIAIDDDDTIRRPSQGNRPLTKRILPGGALRVLQDLPKRALSYIQVGIALQLARRHLLAHLAVHHSLPLRLARTIAASTGTSSHSLQAGTNRMPMPPPPRGGTDAGRATGAHATTQAGRPQ